MKIELNITIYLTTSYTTNSDSASPPNNDTDMSGEVQKARTAQALRAFLYLSLLAQRPLTRQRQHHQCRLILLHR